MRTREPQPSHTIRGSYIRVLVVWLVTLAALYAFHSYYS